MSYSKRSRYSHSPSPYGKYSRSRSQSMSLRRSRSRSRESSAENPGNNLYVTGLSARITKRDLEKHFQLRERLFSFLSSLLFFFFIIGRIDLHFILRMLGDGIVEDVHLVVDPWTGESRGFGFVTMSTIVALNIWIDLCWRAVSLLWRRVAVRSSSSPKSYNETIKSNSSSKYPTIISEGCMPCARRRRGRTPTPGRNRSGIKSGTCDAVLDLDLEFTLPTIEVALHDTHPREIEADPTLPTQEGDHTPPPITGVDHILPATGGLGPSHDLAPRTAGHQITGMTDPTRLMARRTIHLMTVTTTEVPTVPSPEAFHQGQEGATYRVSHPFEEKVEGDV
ncbi:unnamed protein product [Thlaspi arvense]|uniref:RRM domain-containing protein n=1 Tax=Thlaspi arvense TaxID=13288 RepID=A0AAU9SF12_THLAR|nr:unnamed protein product [Thlaspi arvense]